MKLNKRFNECATDDKVRYEFDTKQYNAKETNSNNDCQLNKCMSTTSKPTNDYDLIEFFN